MRVLITNDDGVEAPGLDVLEHIANEISKEVWVVAPETDQSGASGVFAHPRRAPAHARARRAGRYAVKGTPTDCVIMGVRFLLHKDKPPALVLSRVDTGQNLADDVNYSGTVAGAIEGVLLGVPSMALSLAIGQNETGQASTGTRRCATAPTSCASCLKQGWPEGVVLNVNFPDCEPDAVKGMVGDEPGTARIQTSCASRIASIPAASPITGSGSGSAAGASRQRALTSRRCKSAASR